ncbi:hypothetical protein QQS21_004924 [Conoideocrella luteorostrata]|uniref:Aminoglycoside phosphotransferase domain-containing protein n=1 Tax=Conoideocrella luteorostrata TaxID=1105319 RepID=A0AAJ0CTG1_9HYPO|nr:hypothetical protein QQS21_004924 [Conoideocrella luteorostrata]
MSGTQNKPSIFTYAEFNLASLLQLAQTLRGRPCSCDESQQPLAGSMNWAIFLRFDDNVLWVFRSMVPGLGVEMETACRLLASEAATMKFVRQNTSIPVPKVLSYSETSRNDIGIPYILMTMAKGQPLSMYDWRTRRYPDVPGADVFARPLFYCEKSHILNQLARFVCQLSQSRFDKIGSLFERADGSYVVEECLSPSFILQNHEHLENIPRGPFQNEREYYSALVSTLLAHCEELDMSHHILHAPLPCPLEYSNFGSYNAACHRWNDYAAAGSKADSNQNRLEYGLAAMFIRDLVIPCLTAPGDPPPPGFPLRHHNISTQNIYVDENFNITCMLDWALSSTVPFVDSLACPGLPHPGELELDRLLHKSFQLTLKMEFLNSHNVLVADKFWFRGNMSSRLLRLVNFDAIQDYHHLDALHESVCGGESSPVRLQDTLHSISSTPEAGLFAHALAANDKPGREVSQREQKYFDVVGAGRLAIARHVSYMSALRCGINDNPVLASVQCGGSGTRTSGNYVEPAGGFGSKPLYVPDKQLWLWLAGLWKTPEAELDLAPEETEEEAEKQIPIRSSVAQPRLEGPAPTVIWQRSRVTPVKNGKRKRNNSI